MPAVRWHRPAASPHVTWRCRVVLALPVGAVPARRPLKILEQGLGQERASVAYCVASLVAISLTLQPSRRFDCGH